jgi:crossover junction endodeoxyribonuclease RuvC
LDVGASIPDVQLPTSNLQILVLGIDPGLRICGWGIVRGAAKPEFVAGGVIRPRTRDSIGQRLLTLHEQMTSVISTYAPDEVAIEEPFIGALAPASALAIGQARAIAVLAAAAAGLEVELYAPAAVKAAVSGYGQGDKRQVQTMVRLLLGLDVAPEPADAADALAVAICHLANRKTRTLVAERANGQTGKRPKTAVLTSKFQTPTSR